MKACSLIKYGLIIASIVFTVSCSKAPNGVLGADLSVAEATTSHGLGSMSAFTGQEEGELYTTMAPHNQIYLFAYDDSTLVKKYLPSLNAQSEYLKEHPGARVLLAGHTDERGSREYNIALGERRANTVAQIMRMSGVRSHQIRVVSYGKERPVYFGHDEESHRQNRRVELTYEATR